jgi:hypothetical protein
VLGCVMRGLDPRIQGQPLPTLRWVDYPYEQQKNLKQIHPRFEGVAA